MNTAYPNGTEIRNLREKWKKSRDKKEWSQTKVAEKAGVNQKTISNIEKGERTQVKNLEALAKVFGVDMLRDFLDVRRELADRGFTLSQNPLAWISQTDSEWLVTDGDNAYVVRYENRTLHIEKQPDVIQSPEQDKTTDSELVRRPVELTRRGSVVLICVLLVIISGVILISRLTQRELDVIELGTPWIIESQTKDTRDDRLIGKWGLDGLANVSASEALSLWLVKQVTPEAMQVMKWTFRQDRTVVMEIAMFRVFYHWECVDGVLIMSNKIAGVGNLVRLGYSVDGDILILNQIFPEGKLVFVLKKV